MTKAAKTAPKPTNTTTAETVEKVETQIERNEAGNINGQSIEPADPATVTTQSGDVVATITDPTNVIEIKGKGNRASLLDAVKVNVTVDAAKKHGIMTDARQRLAEAFDLYQSGEDKEAEANAVANKAAVALYQARLNGLATMEEVNAVLGDQFGYKTRDKNADKSKPVPASDPQASKTPFGTGEAIRKRIVRACQAAEYLRDPNEGSAYFENIPADKLESVVNAIDAGDYTLWQAYKRIGDIKAEAKEGPVETAFNAKTIAKMVDQLGAIDAAERFASDTTLIAAYAALREAISILDHEAALWLQDQQAA